MHGQESPEYCRNLGRKVIKGFRIRDEDSLRLLADYQGAAQALLLDTYKKGQGGAPARPSTGVWPGRPKNTAGSSWPGALTPENVAQAIDIALPAAVDAASGTEAAPGKKDPAKLRAFFKAIKAIGGGG